MEPLKNIKIKNVAGTWSEIASQPFCGFTLRLLEHDSYGDEAAAVIVVACEIAGAVEVEIVVDCVWNGFDDLADCDEDHLQARLSKCERRLKNDK